MKFAYQSHIGRKRLNNEDYIGVENNQFQQQLFILCDGVGGNKAGEVASQMTVNHLKDMWKQSTLLSVVDAIQWLTEHIERVNTLVYERSKQFVDLEGMSTTIVCATIIDEQLISAHVGDSRLYVYRTPQLKQITQDHTLVYDLLTLGGLTVEEAQNHPMKNVITRAVGNKENVVIDVTQLTLQNHDYVLICSDGLTDMLNDETIAGSFKEWMTLDERVNHWIDQANLAGGKDNISVLLAQYRQKGEE